MTMLKTVLLAQEFGTNLGHVSRLLAVAEQLKGFRFVFAVPHADVAAPVITRRLGADVEVVGGFRFRGSRPSDHPVGQPDKTLADIFYALGYANPVALLSAARKWEALLDRVRPDLIVADFAPTLRLVAGDSVPFIVLGDAFATPPAKIRLPAFMPPNVPVDAISAAHEDRLVETACTVRRAFSGPPVRFFSDLFNGDRTFAIAIPGNDPYAKLRSAPTLTSYTVPHIVPGPPFHERVAPDIFCFLWSDHPSVNTILTALNGIARPSQVHIRGIDPSLLVAHTAPQVGVRLESADFATLLPQTRLFIHYGGVGATYAALLAGTPQLILPMYLEQESTAAHMIAAGVAIGLKLAADADVAALRALILQHLDDKTVQAAALAAAKQQADLRGPNPLPWIAEACRSYL